MKARAGQLAYFYREGKVGDAARHMGPELRAEFDAAIDEQLRGVDDPYRIERCVRAVSRS